jgi:diguanylate cyclase (GGDEF)-like protein
MLVLAGIAFARTPASAPYPWPVTVLLLAAAGLAVSEPHAAIGGPRGSSVEASATGTVLIAAVVLLPPLALPLLLVRTLLLSSARWRWRLWNTAAHALSLSGAAMAYWSINPTGTVILAPARYAVAVTAAAAAYYLLETAAFTWLQTRLHHCSIRETGLWTVEGIVLDAVLLGAGVAAGTLVLVSVALAGVAVLVLTGTVLLLRALDRAQDSYLDTKTGLLQLPAFTRWATRSLAAAERSNRPVSLMMIDLDHFRRLNTTYGHPAGDRVLIAVAHLLSETVRSSDLAGRYGGEEFVVLLTDTDGAGAHRTAERVRHGISELALADPRGVLRITASIGVTTWSPGTDVATLITRADDALYAAKSAGRNRTSISNPL